MQELTWPLVDQVCAVLFLQPHQIQMAVNDDMKPNAVELTLQVRRAKSTQPASVF